nr:MAG TPA: hypothetical protein [Caudoviricetes sp.]
MKDQKFVPFTISLSNLARLSLAAASMSAISELASGASFTMST